LCNLLEGRHKCLNLLRNSLEYIVHMWSSMILHIPPVMLYTLFLIVKILRNIIGILLFECSIYNLDLEGCWNC
jgi:hypothetical protein